MSIANMDGVMAGLAFLGSTTDCFVFEHLYSAPHSSKPTQAIIIRLAPRK